MRTAKVESEGPEQAHRPRRGDEVRHGRSAPSIVSEVLASPGRPLDVVVRSEMEPRFGMDFSRVRVHTDERAHRSTRAVDAVAYTVGSHIVFAAHEYRPATTAGRQLIAHELTHVRQQGTVSRVPTSGLRLGAGNDSAEREAEDVGQRVVAGTPVGAQPTAAPMSVQRKEAHEESEKAVDQPSATGARILESFDVDRGPGRRPWNLDRLTRQIGSGLSKSRQAWIDVVGNWDPSDDVAQARPGVAREAARRRADIVRRALIQWVPVPESRIRASTFDRSLLSQGAAAAVGRQIDIVLHGPATRSRSSAEARSHLWLVVVVPSRPDERGFPSQPGFFDPIPPPIVVDAPQSLAGAVLRLVSKDVNKLLDSPLPIPMAWIIDNLPADWEVRKAIRRSLRDFDKSKAPPLTDVGSFADPRLRNVPAEQQQAREGMPATVGKAFLLAGQAAVPTPPRDPAGATFFIRLPAIPLP
jgi:hypothetical protein